jgi:hypothetical protein
MINIVIIIVIIIIAAKILNLEKFTETKNDNINDINDINNIKENIIIKNSKKYIYIIQIHI